MSEIEKVIKGLNDIGGFIAERIGFEKARNFLRTLDDAIAILTEQPQIVICKDCKHVLWVDNETSNPVCKFNHGAYGLDWYCADGERKQNDAISEVRKCQIGVWETSDSEGQRGI